jgi:thiol:disulfide interchange protein DsbD
VAGVYAVVLVTGATTGADSPLRPFAGLRSSQDPGIEFIAIKGLAGPAGLENALAQASASGRFAMLDFVADWCVSCEEFKDTTLRDRQVRVALEDVVPLRADVTANDEADRALMRRLGILGPPAILFFAPDRTERRRYRLFGLEDADAFTSRVKGATDAA